MQHTSLTMTGLLPLADQAMFKLVFITKKSDVFNWTSPNTSNYPFWVNELTNQNPHQRTDPVTVPGADGAH